MVGRFRAKPSAEGLARRILGLLERAAHRGGYRHDDTGGPVCQVGVHRSPGAPGGEVDGADLHLFGTILRGESTIRGFRNADVREHLRDMHASRAACQRLCKWVGVHGWRRCQMLHAPPHRPDGPPP